MSVRLLTEAEIGRLLTVEDAMALLEAAFREAAAGRGPSSPRRRVVTPPAALHMMSAALPARGVAGAKVYCTTPRGAGFLVPLFDLETGRLTALLEADRLGQIRTGAASGLATRLLARADAAVGAVIGTGWQAETQVEAICAARPLREVRVFGRDAARRHAFADRIGARVRARVVPVASAEAAVRDADVVCTITNARRPVVEGAWLAPSAHVNAAGVNWPNRSELDTAAVLRASAVVVDDLETARLESGTLLPVVEAGHLAWEAVATLAQVVAGGGVPPSLRRPGDITVFVSHGVALEDIACAAQVVERARREGIGREIPWGEPA
jgi:ornithine cyclodeaminase/alanine dehydrogenase-like protein (mu-crystallin family)